MLWSKNQQTNGVEVDQKQTLVKKIRVLGGGCGQG